MLFHFKNYTKYQLTEYIDKNIRYLHFSYRMKNEINEL